VNAGKIVELREAMGMTRYRLAKKSDIAYSYLADIEKGKQTNPTVDIVKKIAAALGVSVNELIY